MDPAVRSVVSFVVGFVESLADAASPLLAAHPSPGLFAVGFSVALVLWLVAAEEAELRRGRPSRG